jgi:hypothetical protein
VPKSKLRVRCDVQLVLDRMAGAPRREWLFWVGLVLVGISATAWIPLESSRALSGHWLNDWRSVWGARWCSGGLLVVVVGAALAPLVAGAM